MNSSSPLPGALWQAPALRPVAPLILSAWQDGYLTPAELIDIRDALQRAPWLGTVEKDILRAWLDPARPPSPQALSSLEREVKAALHTLSLPHGGSIADAGAALVEGSLGADTRRGVYATLCEAQTSLSDSSFDVPGEGPGESGSTQDPIQDADESERLRSVLDGAYAKTRDEVREILSVTQFRFVSNVSTAAYREQALTWCKALSQKGIARQAYHLASELAGGEPHDRGQFVTTFEMLSYFDLSLVVKVGVQFGLFGGAIAGLGTAKHHALLPAVTRCELLGCFAMTERAHGSNVRELQTTARYDPATREFVLHSPSLSAGKEWIGNAALHAHVAVVFAQLETGGERHGVHAFLLPIRDGHGQILPRVRIEDCGEKMGLNGVDNGRLWFDAVRVPREALLDRFGQVAEDGTYTSSIPSPGKRFFTMLGTLVGGRISVAGGALAASKVGLSIALTYAAHRRQFANGEGPEQLLIHYLSHQRRLIPRLAAAYAFSFAQNELVARFSAMNDDETRGRDVEKLAAGVKALGTWQAIDTLQQCRECCGGQGYLTSNRIDALRTDTDVFTTFEGDNTVLLQLVAKELLSSYRRELKDRPLRTLASSVAEDLLTAVTERNPVAIRDQESDSLLSFAFQERAMRFREKSLRDSLGRRIKHRIDAGMAPQQAFDACQDHAIALARAHIEHFVLTCFQRAAASEPSLERLCALYGLWRIEADLAWFLENDYLAASKSRAIRRELNEVVREASSRALVWTSAFGIPKTCAGPLADPEYLRTTGLATS